MKINMDDILFQSEVCLNNLSNQYLNSDAEDLKSKNDFSEKNVKKLFKKYSIENVLNSEHSALLIQGMIIAAISEYHEQLREKLLENGIDIGEMDETSTPLRDGYIKLHQNDE